MLISSNNWSWLTSVSVKKNCLNEVFRKKVGLIVLAIRPFYQYVILVLPQQSNQK